MSELKETKKMKVVQLHEMTPKLQSQKQPIRAQKVKNDPNSRSKSKVRIEGTVENKSCSTA